MHASRERIRTARNIAAALGLLLGACSSTERLEAAGACVEGQSEGCGCAGGPVGVRTCGADNEFGECQCQGSAGVGGSSGSAGTAGVGGSPIGGSAGATGGSAAIGGGGGSAGVAGATGGSAGAGTGGASGVTGGDAGTAGMSTGGVGGASGMEPTGGMSGETGGMSGGPGRDPRPGELYGACKPSGECDDGLLCVNDSSGGVPESYCSTTCDAFAAMPCPKAHGDGMVYCVLGVCLR